MAWYCLSVSIKRSKLFCAVAHILAVLARKVRTFYLSKVYFWVCFMYIWPVFRYPCVSCLFSLSRFGGWLVVSTSASDWLQTLFSDMTYYALGVVNPRVDLLIPPMLCSRSVGRRRRRRGRRGFWRISTSVVSRVVFRRSNVARRSSTCRHVRHYSGRCCPLILERKGEGTEIYEIRGNLSRQLSKHKEANRT